MNNREAIQKVSIYDSTFRDHRRFIRTLKPRLAEIGRIKIGKQGEERPTRSGGTFRLPEKFDHFKITTNERDASGNFIEDTDLMNALDPKNGKPKSIDVEFLFDDPALNLSSEFSLYSGKKRMCWGDGIKATRRVKADNNSDERVEKSIDCPCDFLNNREKDKPTCKPYGILRVIIPQAQRVGGVYVFRTTSWNSIENMYGTMELVRNITKEAGGLLTGITFQLRLIPKTVSPEGYNGNLTVWVVSLEYNGSIQELRERAAERAQKRLQVSEELAAIRAQSQRMIEGDIEDSEIEASSIQQEFYPENNDEKYSEVIDEQTTISEEGPQPEKKTGSQKPPAEEEDAPDEEFSEEHQPMFDDATDSIMADAQEDAPEPEETNEEPPPPPEPDDTATYPTSPVPADEIPDEELEALFEKKSEKGEKE